MEIAPKPLDVDAYIRKRRTEGIHDDALAFELNDKQGNYKLTYLEICRKLDLGKGIHLSIGALKKRGERVCKRGKAMLTKNGKRKKS